MERAKGRQPLGVSLKSGAVRNMGDGGVMHLSQCLHTVSLLPRDADVTLQRLGS